MPLFLLNIFVGKRGSFQPFYFVSMCVKIVNTRTGVILRTLFGKEIVNDEGTLMMEKRKKETLHNDGEASGK
jgi:hypothetical protein